MVQASADHPGLGDMGAVRAFASDMRTRARDLEGMADQIQQAAADVGSPGALEGFAGITWTMRAPLLRATVASIVNVLDARREAAEAYAGEVERIESEATTVWDERGTALRNLMYWQQTPLEYRISFEGQQREQQIQATLYWTRTRLDRLYSDRQSADTTFADALDNGVAVLGHPASAVAGMGARLAPGFSLTDIEAIEAIVATEELAANPGDEDAMLRARSQLADLGDDPQAWSRFYREGSGVSGETLALAIASVGGLWRHGRRDTDDPGVSAGIETASMLREGLATASEHWSDWRAESFAGSMFAAVENNEVTPSTVAFLFNNPEQVLMGSALTLAAATQIDRLERSQGRPMSSEMNNRLDPMTSLSYYANGQEEQSPSNTDVAAQVFHSLGRHPNAALEFLTGDGVDVDKYVGSNDGIPGRDDRVGYWFGIRDWRYDGYEAPLTLLEGMQHAEDGILDSSTNLGALTAAQRDTITAQNEVLTSAFETIAWGGHGGDGWQPYDISDTGDALLMQTVENHQLLIGLSTVSTSDGGSIVGADGQIEVLGSPELKVPHLELDKGTLGQVFARVEDVDAARESLARTGADFTNSMGALLSSGQVDPLTVMNATTGMWAFADGSAQGIAVANGQRADEQSTLFIDLGSKGVGKLAGWAVGEIPVVGGIANDVLVGPGLDYMTGVVTDNVATEANTALDAAAEDRARELSERADPEALIELYEQGGDEWLGGAYRDDNGELNAEAFDAHVRSQSTFTANHYGASVDLWREYVEDREEVARNRDGS